MEFFQEKLKFLRKYDKFGYPISLSFKAKPTYNTICGGFFSIVIVIFFLFVSGYSFYKLFNQEYKETNKYILNLGSSFGDLQLNTDNFMMACKFDNDVLNNWTMPFMMVSLTQVRQFRNASGISKEKININLTKCTQDHFPGLKQEFYQQQLNTSLCPTFGSNLSIEGGFQENVFTYLVYSVNSCMNNRNCQNNKTIIDTIKNIG